MKINRQIMNGMACMAGQMQYLGMHVTRRDERAGGEGRREGGTGCLDCVLVSPYRHSLVGSFCWLLEGG